jgi:hypothetical protein
MIETIQYVNEELTSTPEQLDQERVAIIEAAIAARTLNLCTVQAHDFGDPISALARAETTANID